MIEKQLEDIAYQLKTNKDDGQPGAIVFLGAGVSVTAGIPQAGKIAEEILEKFKDAPEIKKLPPDKQTYVELMSCLTSAQRKKLLKSYIDNARINVAHIYLAQLMQQGYIDYIVTVNFDNLTLRALSLFNEFPATYDISILNDITTSSLDRPAVIFMHGQHHGLWQLNTVGEMGKIDATAPVIFNKIAQGRTWIVIGYGATDPVFDHLIKQGRFVDQLFWISYNNHDPAVHIKEKLLDRLNTDAYCVKGYDADSFFLRLNTALKLPRPDILDRPFSHLKKLQGSVVDVQHDKNLKDVHERMKITGKWIQDAIEKYESNKEQQDKDAISQSDIQVDQLRLDLINRIVERNFEQINDLEKKISGSNDPNTYTDLLSTFYNNWGNSLINLAKKKTGAEAEALYLQAFSKYQRAIELKSDITEPFSNWGSALHNFAKAKTGAEAEVLYQQAFSKYQRAIELKPNNSNAFYNWANSLISYAKTKTGAGSEKLYQLAFSKYQKAIELQPDIIEAFNNWGSALINLAKAESGTKRIELLKEARNKLEEVYRLGGSSYNLACIHALLGNTYDALMYLKKALTNRNITVEHVEADSDWENFSDKEALMSLLRNFK